MLLQVTVTGTEEAILLAQFLIQSNIDLTMKDMRDQMPPPQQQQPPFGGFQDNNYFPDDANRRRGGGNGNGNFRPNFRGGFNNEQRFPGPPDHQQQNDGHRGGFRGGNPRGGVGPRGMRGNRW